MSDYTYAAENREQALEKYEWDNVWWESADSTGVPRVLYIGDSISCQTRRVATDVAEEKIFFDGFGTSKAVDNPYFTQAIRMFAMQQGERFVVLFNNGLHGWHLDDKTAYKQHYERILQFLLEEFSNTPIVLLLTTAIADQDRDARVVERNRAVIELAQQYGLPVIDLYSVVRQHQEVLSEDGVHLLPEGCVVLANVLVEKVKEFLK